MKNKYKISTASIRYIPQYQIICDCYFNNEEESYFAHIEEETIVKTIMRILSGEKDSYITIEHSPFEKTFMNFGGVQSFPEPALFAVPMTRIENIIIEE